MTWNPDYPSPTALAYKDLFERGAALAGLRSIPEAMLSAAITRALERSAPPVTAGRVFANCYYALHLRTKREQIMDPHNYLLAMFSHDLERQCGKNVL
jgi:hypothetical protein